MDSFLKDFFLHNHRSVVVHHIDEEMFAEFKRVLNYNEDTSRVYVMGRRKKHQMFCNECKNCIICNRYCSLSFNWDSESKSNCPKCVKSYNLQIKNIC